MKTMKWIAALAAMFFGMLMLTSCEQEVETFYTYKVDVTNVQEDGGMAVMTGAYVSNVLKWDKAEAIDNDASSKDKAREANDREAIREFNEEVAKYNEMGLYGWYRQNGVQQATGYFDYKLIREDGQVLKEQRFTVNYSAE